MDQTKLKKILIGLAAVAIALVILAAYATNRKINQGSKESLSINALPIEKNKSDLSVADSMPDISNSESIVVDPDNMPDISEGSDSDKKTIDPDNVPKIQ